MYVQYIYVAVPRLGTAIDLQFLGTAIDLLDIYRQMACMNWVT